MSTQDAPAPPFDPARDLAVVILAGGAGTRFWPLSTEARPKQFLPLTSDRSLLQESYDRALALVDDARIFVLTAARFSDLVRQALPALPAANIIGEPARRDTAAALAWAALVVDARFSGATMAVLTADHHIAPKDAFKDCILSAARAAHAGSTIYTLGIAPTHPACGYGYLDCGAPIPTDDGMDHTALNRFVEKPDADRAQRYLDAGNFLWNSGMFVWRTDTLLDLFRQHLPGTIDALAPCVAPFEAGDPEPFVRAFSTVEKISVDYAILEKAPKVACVRATFDWSDVGGFLALAPFLDGDGQQNAHRGRLRAEDAHGNIVFSEEPGELVALLGVDDLIVVRAGRRTLVAHKDKAEQIKALVAKLDEGDR